MADDPEPIGNQYFESMVDKQIREAFERGEFNNLPGFGKPLPELDQPYDEMWWVRDFARREKLSLLPPTLLLRKEAEDARAAALDARSERRAREIITEINVRIAEAQSALMEGPPLNMVPFDVDDVLREWRERHPGGTPSQQQQQQPTDGAGGTTSRRAGRTARRVSLWFRGGRRD